MSDLIRRNDAIESFSKTCVTDDLLGMGVQKGLVIAEMRIKDVSAVDAVEVVRCKDCRYRGDEYECPLLAFAEYTCDDEYCSDGERRENNEID